MLTGRFAGPDRPADLSHAVPLRARRRLRPRLPIGWFRRVQAWSGESGLGLEVAGVLSSLEQRVVVAAVPAGCGGELPQMWSGAPMTEVHDT